MPLIKEEALLSAKLFQGYEHMICPINHIICESTQPSHLRRYNVHDSSEEDEQRLIHVKELTQYYIQIEKKEVFQ